MFRIGGYPSISQTKFGGLYTECDPRDLPMGASPLCYDVDFSIAGIGPRPGLGSPLALNFSPSAPTGVFEWFRTHQEILGPQSGTIYQNSEGSLWWENIANEGTLTRIYTGILNSARALSESVSGRVYICFSDLLGGSDQPRQWDGTNLDRISQVGPGAGPTGPVARGVLYAVVNVSQPDSPRPIDSIAWGASINLYTAQPAANTLWFLSKNSSFTAGINVNDTINVSGAVSLNGFDPNGTYVVTSVGNWTDVDGTYYYVGVVSDQVNSEFARGSAGGNIQLTYAIVQLSQALPPDVAQVGESIAVSGNSVQQWNNSWKISGTPANGQLSISATQLSGDIASYTYSRQSGTPPGWQPDYEYVLGSQIVDNNGLGHVWMAVEVTGLTGGTMPSFPASPSGNVTDGGVIWAYQSGASMLATVYNTANGNGVFNVANAVILSASTASFTVGITAANVSSASEIGEAVTGSGTMLQIDPGTAAVGSGHPGVNPIYGTGTGGEVTSSGTGEVAAGLRYAVLLFQTRNGGITPASPPVKFYTTGATDQISFGGLAIGPPNVIARIIAITAANSDIEGPYYYIPEEITVQGSTATLGITTTVNATVVPDNSTTTLGPITILDSVLLNSTNITEVGNNLLQQRELGECVKAIQYAGRVIYLGERVKVDNFVNLTFDGGTVSGLPAGWNTSGSVSVVTSPIFGQSLQLASGALVSQAAYESIFSTAIIQPSTAYSVRVTAWGAGADLTIKLTSASGGPWAATFTLTSAVTEYIAAFNNPLWDSVPSDLDLVVSTSGATATVDRIEIFPTEQPFYTTRLAVSYLDNPEGIDAVTGAFDISRFTSEPALDCFRFIDQIYIKTRTRAFLTTDVDGEEPAEWDIKEVSNATGSFGPMAFAAGEEYSLEASFAGLYLFDGGNHIKISQEIQKIWDSIYLPSAKTMWVRNDLSKQRILVGIPLPTPNPWLPNAPANATPSTPNVILMCSYLTLEHGAAIAAALAVEPSMFTGHLLWREGKRKWTIWQIPATVGDFVLRSDGSDPFWVNGSMAKIFALDESQTEDNGVEIQQRYVASPLPDSMTEMQLPLMPGTRKLFPYATALIDGSGKFNVAAWPESLNVPSSWAQTQPSFGLAQNATDDQNIPLWVSGNRMLLDFTTDGNPGSVFFLKKISAAMSTHPRMGVSGR